MPSIFKHLVLLSGLFVAISAAGQNYPIGLGYIGGQSVPHDNDSMSFSFGGGMLVPTNWKVHVDNGVGTKATGNTPMAAQSWLSGFRYNSVYLEQAFNGPLFVSKGYYGDYVEVRWDLARYTSTVTGFKIYRRLYLSGDDFEQVANLPSDARSWQDEYSESNVLYEYKVLGLDISPIEEDGLNFQTGVGFRTPTGRISGRITYEGGTAVEGVTVVAETEDDFAGVSLRLNGTSDYLTVTPELGDSKFEWADDFAFQGWFRPDNDIAATQKTLMQKGAQYHLTYQKSGANHVVRFKANATTLSLTFPAMTDTFFHVAAVRETDSLKLYALYDTDTTYTASMAYAGTTPKNDNAIFLGKDSVGNYFKGHIDEIRLWDGEITQEDVELDGPRYLDGTEANLVGYYRLNENMGTSFYDLSRKGFSFNENHGDVGTADWSDTIPLTRQLAVKGITDANGNYTISGIPYETDGSIYRFVPIYGIHEFDPTEQSFYVGPGSNVYSNVNFVDVASFPVVGYIYYRSTDFPVKGVNVRIDGDLLISAGGAPVSTSSLGRFEFDVPIGQHTVEFEKTGHLFSNGSFSRDFQEPYTLQYDIIDTTLVKVVGKVVGGPIEANKPIGLGKTVNNLGRSRVTLSNANYNYASAETISTYQHPYYTDSTEVIPDDGGSPKSPLSTTVKIPGTDRKTVEIYPDTTTGEYVAYLLPELYTVASVKSGGDGTTYHYDLGEYPDINLKNEYLWYTEIDSVTHPVTPFIISNGDTVPFYEIDSVQYNKNLDFIYRVTPSVHVAKSNGDTAFWDTSIDLGGTSTDLINGTTGKLETKYPIFTQRGSYKTKITVFESYENKNNGSVQNVPVTDGKVEIINNLSNNPTTQLFEIDSTGKVLYDFTGGKPNMNGEFDQSMSVVAITGNGGNIRTAWRPTIRWFGGTRTEVFKGIVLGSIPKGNNFITKGPDQVDMIIRDPYGSESFAFYEVGNSVSISSTSSFTNELSVDRNLTTSLGTKVVTWQGVGAGVIQESETIADVTVGLSANTNWETDETTTETITNTKTWSTSSDPAFVGANGDVFVGRSMNIVYGTADRLEFKTGGGNALDNLAGYDITPYETLRFSPEFSTAFQYSQNHIEGYLIPNLEELRDSIILGCCDSLKPYYTFAITDPDNANFGKKNTTATTYYYDGGVDISASRPTDPSAAGYTANLTAFTNLVDSVFVDGDQYDIRLNFVTPGASNYWADRTKEFPDRIREYATSIAGWEAVLLRNEKEKVEAEIEQNLSFDAGTVYSSTKTIENEEEIVETFSFGISPQVASKLGGEVMGIGMETEYTRSYTHTETDADGTTTTSSVTFGFELSDGDEGDYYSMDVKTPKTNTGPVFAVKGGQSMCPYVDQELTKYHQVGTQLSAATEKREVPTLTCDDPIQLDVPGDDPAIFEIELANNSQSSDDQWYMLRVDESTNQDGASVKLDGGPIGNGRVIFVPHTGFGGDGITKTITIEQVNQAVTDYDNIKLILHSICQYDPGDDWEDIHDFVEISAHFTPVCTPVEIDDPDDLWTRNIASGTSMDVVLDGYDRNRADFDKILFQYKPTSSSTWSTAMQFFNTQHSTASYDAAVTAGQAAQVIGGATINYTFDMEDQPDRQYNIRAKSVCSTGPENASATLTGIKDIKPPKVFGTPQPGDGILSPGEDVMIRFDEDIEAGLLISRNFSVRGVLNGSPLRHSAALYFDGTDDYCTTSQGVDYSNSSFSVEMWVKRDALSEASVLYQQNGVEIGYTATDEIYVNLANGTATTTKKYNFTDKWIHYTVSYDAELEKLFMYVAYDGYDGIDLSDVAMSPNFNASGRVYVGSNSANNKPFQGYIHDFRVWEKFIGQGTSAANMSVQMNGDEIGMGAFWPMNELKGELANDLSRSHHLLLYGPDWRVFPSGQAYNFDGSTSLDFPTGSSVVISNSMDFTIEFYFRADSSQKGVVLFSNGRTDGTDDFAKEDIWEIGINGDGNVYALNNGTYIEESTGGYNDDSWHHFALVLRRKSNTTMYLDGESKGFKHSSFFGGLKGAAMTIGASRDYGKVAGAGGPYNDGLTGKMDELRIWNLARTKELLNMDISSKLSGDEMGLVAYYPLDAYDINLLLVSTLNDQDFNDVTDTMSTLSMTATGGSFEGSDVPNIQTPRPVQTLNYDWVVNGDEMIIIIEEQPSLVEKRVIEFTVRNVEDKNRNELASPETWTAYIKQNTVVWDETALDYEIAQYNGLEFEVDILNIGGVEQDYTISNLPQWLSVNAESGTLTPDSRKTLTFEVSEGINVGTHEEVLYLTTDFGYNERLRIQVKVTGDEPEWEVEPSDFQYSMNVIGSIAVDNILSTDIDDRIAAVVNGEIRGLGELQYYPAFDSYLVFLDVFSNTASGEEVEFYVWDASEGKVHNRVEPDLDFLADALHGDPNTPKAFNATNILYEPIAVKAGWNWISFPLNSEDHGDINNLLEDLDAEDGDVFRSLAAFDQYASAGGMGWVGGLTAAGGVTNAGGYKLKISNKDTIHYVGAKVSADTIEIPITVGWNWMGYVALKNLAIADAFTNYTPEQGDLLKSQLSFAIYDTTLGWVGNLTSLKPKSGYMFKSSKVDTLIYPNANLFQYKQEPASTLEELYASVGLVPEDYQYNMNVVGKVDFCEGLYIANRVEAWRGDQIVGVGNVDQGRLFLTVYGNENDVPVELRILDEAGHTFTADQELAFKTDELVGALDAPYLIESSASITECLNAEETVITSTLTQDLSDGQIYVQNSLDRNELSIHYRFDQATDLKIELYDAAGRWIADLFDQSRVQGQSKIGWNQGHVLAPGVYVLKMLHGDEVVTQKVVNPIN